MKSNFKFLTYVIALNFFVLLVSCNSNKNADENNFGPKTKELIQIVDSNPKIKSLLTEAIKKSHEINPDTATNPVQNLNDFYKFISWCETAMPWELVHYNEHAKLYDRIDQSLSYLYFIIDIPLPELQGKGYYNNSLQYEEPFCSWLKSFNKGWGSFLDSKESWNDKYLQLAIADEKFGLNNDWYEDASNWKTFNQFFVRKLKSPDKRPIASPNDESIVISPADAVSQGVWEIDSNSVIADKDGVAIKTGTLFSVQSLLGQDSKYKNSFAGGTFTHTFLDLGDYHRYHFPMSGVVKEVRIIPATNNTGYSITWDTTNKRYAYNILGAGWQAIETRGCIILETKEFGLVALLPIGMSPVCSVNFLEQIKAEVKVSKGDEMGYFLFGGSDFIMIFQKQANFVLDVPKEVGGNSYKHLLMGQRYGHCNNINN
jgi:phosphatidylserine decarboxylase precursor